MRRVQLRQQQVKIKSNTKLHALARRRRRCAVCSMQMQIGEMRRLAKTPPSDEHWPLLPVEADYTHTCARALYTQHTAHTQTCRHTDCSGAAAQCARVYTLSPTRMEMQPISVKHCSTQYQACIMSLARAGHPFVAADCCWSMHVHTHTHTHKHTHVCV